MTLGKTKPYRLWLALGVAAIAALVLASMFGAVALTWAQVWDFQSSDARIFFQLRIPRALVAFLAGAGLAMAGLVFQVVFLNALATPYTLGVSSGASCGAAVAICLGTLPGWLAHGGVAMGALLGASVSVCLILWFGRTKLGHQRHAMLLAGVAISFFFSSLLLLIQYLADFYQSFQIIRWLMGGISVAGYREVLTLLPVVLFGFGWLVVGSAKLNMLLLGDDLAHTRGLAVMRTKNQFVVVVSLMVGVIVSITGPIGFVGMIVPHICRLFWGTHHRVLVPGVALVGGTALVLCDLVARLVLAPNEMPVGVITALIGAPFFFFLLLKKPYRL